MAVSGSKEGLIVSTPVHLLNSWQRVHNFLNVIDAVVGWCDTSLQAPQHWCHKQLCEMARYEHPSQGRDTVLLSIRKCSCSFQLITCLATANKRISVNPLITTLKTHSNGQYSAWYTGRWWVGCYIWYSEEGPGWGCSPPRPLLAVPNVTAHPSTASVPTSYCSMWHYNCLWSLKVNVTCHAYGSWNMRACKMVRDGEFEQFGLLDATS